MTAELFDAVSAGDLARLADGIVIPSDLPWSPRARAFIEVVTLGVDHPPLARCTHQAAYRPAWSLDGGRRDEPIGPTFADRGPASQLVRLLNGEADAITGDGAPAPSPGGRSCVVCDTPLPAGSRVHRMTCSAACRVRLARERRTAAQAGGPGDAPAPPSGPAAPGGGVGSPTGEPHSTPTDNVTTRPAAPAVQLGLFDPIPETEMGAAFVATAAPEPEVRDDRTAPTP